MHPIQQVQVLLDVVVHDALDLRDERDERERHPEAGEDDVEPEAERHLVPGGEEIRLRLAKGVALATATGKKLEKKSE